MTPSDVLTRLAIADAHELLAPHWQTSANCLPDQPRSSIHRRSAPNAVS
ncbi:MAG: hypothetical protein VYB08_04500 [Candidatus Latescibacterota bacterium]|nr:hypothetical protein [Candidatus Latescibacterota bacterium]